MSNKRRLTPPYPMLAHRDPVSSSNWMSFVLSVPDRSDGGAYRDRTDDLMLAKQPLSQLS
jgi:hypothetical protein